MVAICVNATTNWTPTVFNLMSNELHMISDTWLPNWVQSNARNQTKKKKYEQMQMLINRMNFNCFDDSWDEKQRVFD